MKKLILLVCLLSLAQAEVPTLVSSEHGLTLSVRASGAPPLTYQWFLSGKALPAQESQKPDLVLTPPYKSGLYYCEVSNSSGKVTSEPIRLANTGQADAAPITITFKN